MLDYVYYGATSDDWGIAGLVERCRFAFIPPGIAGRWTANRINDSSVCFELIQRDYVIPKNTGYYESVRPIEDIFERDRGGIIISPKICEVHENVGELDYESEFPNIIVKENISFETVTVNGIRKKKKDAVLPLVTKRMRKSFDQDSKE